MNKVIENIVTRRSCKSFQTEMVPDELIDEIVQAGLLGLQDEYEGIGNCVIGYAKHLSKDIPPRRDNRVFRI